MTTSEQIYSAVETAWEDNAKVGVVFEVMNSAGVVHDQHYPDRGLITMPDGSVQCIINVSISACKSFNFNEEFGDFTYDIAVEGKPFFGNIKPVNVKAVFDMNNHTKVYYVAPLRAGSMEITMPKIPHKVLPLNKQEGHSDWYVSHTTIFNTHITPARSLAKLRLV